MLRSAYVIVIYLAFLILGLSAPFVFSLGYVWVDTFSPQTVATQVLPLFPVSLVMAAAAIGGYVILDRKSPPPLSLNTVLVLLLAIWVTLSTFSWAVVPAMAEAKWNVAIKTILFSAFLPFVFRSRTHFEAFLQVYLFSLTVQFVPFGLKTLISGGGYGRNLGVLEGNTPLSEGATLATVTLMLVPIVLYLIKHGTLLPKSRITTIMYVGLMVLAVAASIGTYERTALVGFGVIGIFVWLRSKRKILVAIAGIGVVSAIIAFGSVQWLGRMSTTTNFAQEDSALARILVWEWTLGFVAEHPQGGGFNSYFIDTIRLPSKDPHGATVVHGKAFHSIFFEVLGEQGWIGLGLFLALIVNSLVMLRTVASRCRQFEGMEWCRDLAFALQASLLTLVCCGVFIGIAFQPMLYYMFAASTCLRQYVARVDSEYRKRLRSQMTAPWAANHAD
jgi:probable O-glycosylation ligase (exosortase A-associated)